jgi:hypothetical protein
VAAWNDLDIDANLHPRMVLVAWVSPDFDADKENVSLLDEAGLIVVTRGSTEHMDLAEARTGRVRVEYVAKGKEKLSDIAKKYGMGSHDLARINRISYSTVLDKGDKIVVYQVVDPKRSERAEEQWKKTPKSQKRSAKRDEKRDGDDGDKKAEKKAVPTDKPISKPSDLM